MNNKKMLEVTINGKLTKVMYSPKIVKGLLQFIPLQ